MSITTADTRMLCALRRTSSALQVTGGLRPTLASSILRHHGATRIANHGNTSTLPTTSFLIPRTTSTLASSQPIMEKDLPFGTRETVYTNEQHQLARTIQRELSAALKARNFPEAASLWTALVQARVLGLVSRHSWIRFCSTMEAIGREIPENLDEQVIDALDSLSAHAAAVGFCAALCCRMRSYISDGNPLPVIRLFVRTVKLLRQRDKIFEDQSSLSLIEYQKLLQRCGPRVQLDFRITCHVITALTLKGPFQDGLRLFLHPSLSTDFFSDTLIPYGELIRWVAVSTDNVPLRRRAVRYGTRIRLATVLASNHAAPVITFFMTSASQLKHILRMLLDEISDMNHSFIAILPSLRSDKHPVLIEKDSDYWGIIMWATTRHGFHDYGKQLRTGLLKLYGSVPTNFDAGKLDGLADLGNIDDVQATWDAYRSAEPSGLPHADICRAYMSALLKAERPEDAMRVFEDVRRRMGEVSNIAPEASLLRLYHVALEVLLRQSKIAEAQSILVDMQNRGPHPSVVTYNILLRHLAVLKQAKQLESIFTRMRTDGLHPNKESYSWLIVGLRTVHSDATRRVLEMMKADGALEANGATFGWMIRFLTGKKFVQNEEAFLAAVDILNFLNGHMSGPLRPTEIGIVRLLCAIERRVWADPAFENLLREAIASVARRHGRDILGRSQNAYEIITACLQNPTPAATQRAWQYYREHAGPVPKGDQYPPQIPMEDTWIELLDGFKKRGEWGLADSLVKEIEAYEQFTTFTTQGLLWSRKLVRQRSSADKSFEKYSNTM